MNPKIKMNKYTDPYGQFIAYETTDGAEHERLSAAEKHQEFLDTVVSVNFNYIMKTANVHSIYRIDNEQQAKLFIEDMYITYRFGGIYCNGKDLKDGMAEFSYPVHLVLSCYNSDDGGDWYVVDKVEDVLASWKDKLNQELEAIAAFEEEIQELCILKK